MESTELIGLDLGQVRTGLARASSVAKIAEPLKTIPTQEVLKELEKIANSLELEAVVIGLPRNLEGKETDQTRWVRDWAKQAKPKIKAGLFWIDEALTTQKAGELKKNYKNADEDSLAATAILQDFIDTPPGERVLF